MINSIGLKRGLTITCLVLMTGCGNIPRLDEVLPDKREQYQRSRSLPDLEVPPDLTLEQADETMEIPGEEPATLSEYQRQRRQRSGQSTALQTLESHFPGEQVLAVEGTPADVWPKLLAFWELKGYPPELSDPELGVMETAWVVDGKTRERFKVFAEPDETGLNTVLLISSEREENVGLDDDNPEWLISDSDSRKEKQLVAELRSEFFTETPVAAATSTPRDSAAAEPAGGWNDPDASAASPSLQAEIVDAGDSRYFLTIPEEYTRAWRRTESLLLESGLFIEDKDQERGLYFVFFASQNAAEEEKGFFSKLKFWGDDEPQGKAYQISLTGVGDNTELVVLNEEGDWETGNDAGEILSLLQKRYNGI